MTVGFALIGVCWLSWKHERRCYCSRLVLFTRCSPFLQFERQRSHECTVESNLNETNGGQWRYCHCNTFCCIRKGLTGVSSFPGCGSFRTTVHEARSLKRWGFFLVSDCSNAIITTTRMSPVASCYSLSDRSRAPRLLVLGMDHNIYLYFVQRVRARVRPRIGFGSRAR